MTVSRLIARRLVDDGRRRSPKVSDPVPFSQQVRALRNRLDLTQEQFSEKYRIPLGNLRNWEQDRNKKPDSASQLLISLIDEFPDDVANLIAKSGNSLRSLELVAV